MVILKKYFPVFFSLLLLWGCEKDVKFKFDMDHLVGVTWGIPDIVEPGFGDINLDAPTIFRDDGTVELGPSVIDFWSLRDSRSIFLEQTRETWFIIDLSPARLYVEKTKFPEGTFIAKCIYYPMEMPQD